MLAPRMTLKKKQKCNTSQLHCSTEKSILREQKVLLTFFASVLYRGGFLFLTNIY